LSFFIIWLNVILILQLVLTNCKHWRLVGLARMQNAKFYEFNIPIVFTRKSNCCWLPKLFAYFCLEGSRQNIMWSIINCLGLIHTREKNMHFYKKCAHIFKNVQFFKKMHVFCLSCGWGIKKYKLKQNCIWKLLVDVKHCFKRHKMCSVI
jgi:hypothetical protein